MNRMLDLEAQDPFRYGWRYVRRQLPDGREEVDQVPLSLEDVLYPEEEDYVVQKPPHLRDFEYSHSALTAFYVDLPSVVVLGDCRVDWGVEGVRPLGPDVLVLFDVRQWLQQGTFRIAEEGGRPILVMEIASPSTRVHDLGAKIDLYYRAGVQIYVIIDRGPLGEDPARLLGRLRGPDGWVPLVPDAQGRLNLAPVPLLLGLEDDHPWFYDAVTGQRLPDLSDAMKALGAANRALQQAEKRAEEEAQARAEAVAKAQEEAQVRAALEQRLRELEERLRNGHN